MNNLILLRNDLKNKKPPKYKAIGITCEIILSRKIFKNNKDIIPFLNEVFEIEFKEYVINSRTTIIARTSRIIYDSDDHNYLKYKQRLYKFIDNLITDDMNKSNVFDGWL